MEAKEKNRLRLVFVDILKGFSVALYKKNKIYFKHSTSFDSGDIEYRKYEFSEKAKQNGLPTEEQKEGYLILEKLWSKENNEEIKKINSHLSNLRQTKSKLFKNEDLKNINYQIDQEKIKLNKLTTERKDLLGFTSEDYANKRVNEYYMFNSLFKSETLKDRYFSEEEFDELENKDVSEIISIFNKVNEGFAEYSLKKIALSSYYLNLFNLCEENPYYMYGKPVVDLTFYQMEVFGYARYFRSVLSEAKHKPTDELYEDPDKLLEWLESSKNFEEAITKETKVQKTGEGAIGTSIIGADKEDLAKIKNTENAISLDKEAAKKGGTLNMEDLMKLHGIK